MHWSWFDVVSLPVSVYLELLAWIDTLDHGDAGSAGDPFEVI